MCEAVADHEHREFAEQFVVFPDDAGATAALVTEHAKLLKRRGAVAARTLSKVVTTLQHAATEHASAWLDSFRLRYLDVELSGGLYERWRSGWPALG